MPCSCVWYSSSVGTLGTLEPKKEIEWVVSHGCDLWCDRSHAIMLTSIWLGRWRAYWLMYFSVRLCGPLGSILAAGLTPLSTTEKAMPGCMDSSVRLSMWITLLWECPHHAGTEEGTYKYFPIDRCKGIQGHRDGLRSRLKVCCFFGR